jgi:hypothetical protein
MLFVEALELRLEGITKSSKWLDILITSLVPRLIEESARLEDVIYRRTSKKSASNKQSRYTISVVDRI